MLWCLVRVISYAEPAPVGSHISYLTSVSSVLTFLIPKREQFIPMLFRILVFERMHGHDLLHVLQVLSFTRTRNRLLKNEVITSTSRIRRAT